MSASQNPETPQQVCGISGAEEIGTVLTHPAILVQPVPPEMEAYVEQKEAGSDYSVRDHLIEVAKLWPGHAGVDWTKVSTERLVDLIKDASAGNITAAQETRERLVKLFENSPFLVGKGDWNAHCTHMLLNALDGVFKSLEQVARLGRKGLPLPTAAKEQ